MRKLIKDHVTARREKIQRMMNSAYTPDMKVKRKECPGDKLTLTFNSDIRCYKNGHVVDLDKSVCFVGQNGSGKSTIIDYFMGYLVRELGEKEVSRNGWPIFFNNEVVVSGLNEKRVFILSATKNNIKINKESGSGLASDVFLEILNMSHSSGMSMQAQCSKLFMDLSKFNPKDALLILDEPEMSLDIYGEVAVAAHIKAFLEKGYHIITATHSERIMAAYGTVTRVPDMKIFDHDKYIKLAEDKALREWTKQNQ